MVEQVMIKIPGPRKWVFSDRWPITDPLPVYQFWVDRFYARLAPQRIRIVTGGLVLSRWPATYLLRQTHWAVSLEGEEI